MIDAVLSAPGRAVGVPHAIDAAQGGFVIIDDRGGGPKLLPQAGVRGFAGAAGRDKYIDLAVDRDR